LCKETQDGYPDMFSKITKEYMTNVIFNDPEYKYC